MEIYIHSEGPQELRLVIAEDDVLVEEFIRVHGGADEASVWLEGADEPLSATITLSSAGVSDRDHVHIGRCRRVAVSVRYGGDSKSNEFPPGATIHTVFEWATGSNGFALTPGEKAKHTLALCGTTTEADRTAHVGSLATDCALCLDLAPKVRFEG
jgi:hypothetical protein